MGTDGSAHTAQKIQSVARESCARLGQRRQSPVFATARQCGIPTAATGRASGNVILPRQDENGSLGGGCDRVRVFRSVSDGRGLPHSVRGPGRLCQQPGLLPRPGGDDRGGRPVPPGHADDVHGRGRRVGLALPAVPAELAVRAPVSGCRHDRSELYGRAGGRCAGPALARRLRAVSDRDHVKPDSGLGVIADGVRRRARRSERVERHGDGECLQSREWPAAGCAGARGQPERHAGVHVERDGYAGVPNFVHTAAGAQSTGRCAADR